MKKHSSRLSIVIVCSLAYVFPVLLAVGAERPSEGVKYEPGAEAQNSENSERPPSNHAKPRKKKSKKRHSHRQMPGMDMGKQNQAAKPSDQSMPGMETGKQKPTTNPSEQPMPGMDMGKQKQAEHPGDQSMPGMEMSKPKPAANPSDQSMPGMDMGQQKPTAKSSEPAMSGMQMGKPGTPGQMAGMDEGEMNMNPYFTTINYPIPKDMMMVMLLPDFQSARTGPNFFTVMEMAEYGITSRWSAGFMAEQQKIFGMPATFGGLRANTYFRLFPHDHLLNFTLYGEYEYLNQAALYKMEVSGFGVGDLVDPLSLARNLPAHTFEQRVIMYHDWGRVSTTFNFVNETGLETHENNFGYAWGIFRRPEWTGMSMGKNTAGKPGMAGMAAGQDLAGKPSVAEMAAPPVLSLRRLGFGLEMIGALGNNHQFGFYWHRQQQYLGPVFSYSPLPHWTIRLEPTFGLSDVSDRFVLRMGLEYSMDQFVHRLARVF